jgi:hypothetical protein
MSRRLYTLAIALAALAAPMAASAQYGGRTVRCESDDHRTEVCRIDTRGGVRIVDQESRAPCIQGRTWGYDGRGIWVSQGCRARFQIGSAYASRNSRYYGNNGYTAGRNGYYGNGGYYGGSNGYYGNSNGYYGNSNGYYGGSNGYYGNGGYGTGSYGTGRYDNPIAAILGAVLGGGYDNRYYAGRQPQTFRCESVNGYPRFCRLPFEAHRIDLRRQLSHTRCDQGYNWGWQRDGVWVERGCRAEFIVY